jgi:phage head maturation protease
MEKPLATTDLLHRDAAFRPATLNRDERTVELVWSTGARVLRQPWFDDPFYEELSLSADAVDLSRLNAGANLLNNHNSGSLDDVIGVVERAWVEGGEARARVRFSSRPDVDGIWRDVQDGILRNVSVGYTVQDWEQSQRKGDPHPTLTATRWLPMELSIVGVPADAGAQVRDQPGIMTPQPDHPMADQNTAGSNPAVEQQNDKQQTRAAAPQPPAAAPQSPETGAAEQRVAELEAKVLRLENEQMIRATAERAGLDSAATDEVVEAHVEDTTAALQAIVARLAARQPKFNSMLVDVTRDEGDDLVDGLRDAIAYRTSLIRKPTDNGKRFMGATVIDMAKAVLERDGISHVGLSRDSIFSRALHTTTDFPDLFTSTAERTLASGYAEEEATWMPFCRQQNLPDFRERTEVEVFGSMLPSPLRENGEYTHRSFSTSKGGWSITTYAMAIQFSREMAINDDLSALTRVPEMIGRGFRRLESNMIYELLTTGSEGAVCMRDAITLFNAAHNNTGTGAISIEAIGDLMKAMRLQQSPSGDRLNIRPSYLLVPAAIETVARQFLNGTYFPTKKVGNEGPNPYANSMELIVEPRLDDKSATQFYGIASPGQSENIFYGYLEGQEGPVVDSEELRDPDGLKIMARFDFGATVVNHRGFYRSSGS